jgi:hypothetical protein
MHRKQCEIHKNKLNSINESNNATNETTVVVEKQQLDHLHDMIFCLQTELQYQTKIQSQIQTQFQSQTNILSQIQTQLQSQNILM